MDGTDVYTEAHCYASQSDYICGNSGYKDSIADRITAPFAHTAHTLTLKFSSYLNELPDNESWGIKNVVIALKPSHQMCLMMMWNSRAYSSM
mgnify:CR=1 FL=1